ncbi:DUF4437 domain-containing protein [Rubritalea marina]|uniref:DUF4437 domain-containing protein n=1 Tax=Rubritalea marina TaxID=361055 RepID=UPI0003791094|nr:DUF4437 domain-containing protein [Rubritalea marina]
MPLLQPLKILALFSSMLALGASAESKDNLKVITGDEVAWGHLNPARGAQGPQAANLWGDRAEDESTGFLVKFVDGFASPPHIHNVSYRAVVISGEIHNDDPDAAEIWMPVGSYWTQPKGQEHITAAKGAHNVALVEIDRGPYLVLPVDESFDDGERPINVDPANLVWLKLRGWEDGVVVPERCFLWGKVRPGHGNGSFLRLPAGFRGHLLNRQNSLQFVVVSGQLTLDTEEATELPSTSYVELSEGTMKSIPLHVREETVLYVRSVGDYQVLEKNP